jgi:hypothetical protein
LFLEPCNALSVDCFFWRHDLPRSSNQCFSFLQCGKRRAVQSAAAKLASSLDPSLRTETHHSLTSLVTPHPHPHPRCASVREKLFHSKRSLFITLVLLSKLDPCPHPAPTPNRTLDHLQGRGKRNKIQTRPTSSVDFFPNDMSYYLQPDNKD